MIDFDLTEDQRIFKYTIRAFAEKEIGPLVEKCEETMTFPVALFSKMGELGYLGMGYPPEYGGSGADKIMQCIWKIQGCQPQARIFMHVLPL